MEWLNEENETPFVVDSKRLAEKIKHVLDNKRVIDTLKRTDIEQVEKRNLLLSGVNSLALDDWNARKTLPPYTKQVSPEYRSVIGDYVDAQSALFSMLDREPYLYPDLLQRIYSVLTGKMEDVARKDKAGFRTPASASIQTPYFNATPAAKVPSEMAFAFMQYAFISGDLEKDAENITKLHAQMVRIQPFMCANKRMAFLVTNGMFKLAGLSPITLCKTQEENAQYAATLKKAILGRDATDLEDFFLDKQLQAQQDEIDQATESIFKSREPIIE